MDMKAAVIFQPGDVQIMDRVIPIPEPEEVLIQIKACGVCGTDHSLFTGGFPARYPVIIGHEFSGVVEAVGEKVETIKPGDRVTVDPNRVCHYCEYCRMGKEHLCENRLSMGVDIDGANAEYCTMQATNVHKIPDSLTFEEAAFTEPLACAIRGIEMAKIHHGDTVLILGGGGMGNLLLQLAVRAGAAEVLVSEPIARRRELAMDNGASQVIDPTTQDVGAELQKRQRIGANVVIEAAGNLDLQTSTLKYVCKGGVVVWFGCSPSDGQVNVNSYDVNDREITICGSFNNPFASNRAVNLLGTRKIRVDNLISHRIPLKDYLEVFQLFGNPETMKLMVTME